MMEEVCAARQISLDRSRTSRARNVAGNQRGIRQRTGDREIRMLSTSTRARSGS